jgi:hypothetical protein
VLQLETDKLKAQFDQIQGEETDKHKAKFDQIQGKKKFLDAVHHSLNISFQFSASHNERVKKVCRDKEHCGTELKPASPSLSSTWRQLRQPPADGRRLRAELLLRRYAHPLSEEPFPDQSSLQSQKEGGRTLIGSDFDQSSSPHEPLRSALVRGAQEPERPRTAAALPQTPTSPLTALNTSTFPPLV